MTTKMNDSTIQAQLETLNKNSTQTWQIKDGKLHKSFKFSNFIAAFGFMSQVAILAEKADHHPEWLNAYSRVDIDLTTHEVGGISQRDFDLAQQIENTFIQP